MDEWREISENFYLLAGIEGQVVGTWNIETSISELGSMLRGLDVEKEEQQMPVDEYLEQLSKEVLEEEDVDVPK